MAELRSKWCITIFISLVSETLGVRDSQMKTVLDLFLLISFFLFYCYDNREAILAYVKVRTFTRRKMPSR